LGGGRGLLMADMLRVLANFGAIPQSINMIEASDLNSREQQKKVLEWFEKQDLHFKFSYELKNKEIFVGENNEHELRWFKTLE
jgi:SAM-dependent MidA family methyltransferase